MKRLLIIGCGDVGLRVAMLLRARYLVDVDCWTEVRGQPIKPGTMCRVIQEKLNLKKRKVAKS